MNWRRLSAITRYWLIFPSCLLIFVNCASATIGLLYLQTPFDLGFQYLPVISAAGYFVSRILLSVEKGLYISTNEVLGYLFIGTVALSAITQLYLGLDAIDRDGISSLDYTVAMWVFSTFYFFAGAACNKATYRKSDIVALLLLLLVLVPFLSAPKQSFFIDYWQLRQSTGLAVLTHLIIAEWCVFLLLGSFAFASERLRPIVIVVSGVCLFGMQGRSSTVFTVFTLLAFWFLAGGQRKVFAYTAAAGVIVLAATFFPVANLISEDNADALDRMMLSADDGSLVGRREILKQSLQHLPASSLYGDPTYIAIEATSMGSYIHNILSMWQFYGLLPFLLVVVCLYRSVRLMIARIRQANLSVMEEFACMLLIYSTVSVILSKAVVFYWVWFAIGYWMLQYSGSNRKPAKSARKSRSKSKRKSKRRRSSSVPAARF